MLITVKYFGLIAEITQCENEPILFSEKSIKALLDLLYVKYPDLRDKNFEVAQNQELVPIESLINGNEIALLPPFAGG